MRNLKHLPEKLLVVAGIFYYYVSTLFPDNIQQMLTYTAIVGIVLAAVVIIRYLVMNVLTRKVLMFMIFTLLSLLLAYALGWSNIVWIILMSIALLGLSRNSFIKTVFYSSAALFALTVGLSIWGPLPLEYINFAGEVEQRYGAVKYTLGFDGPNQAAFAWFAVLMSGLYTYGNNRAARWSFVLVTIAVGMATGSRTGLICSLLFIGTFLVVGARYRYKDHPVKKKNHLVAHLFVFLTIISIVLALTLKNSSIANELLSQRPSTVAYYLESDYIPLITGSNEVYNKAEFQTPPVDNFPVYTLGKYGVLGFIGLATLFYISMKRELSWKIRMLFIFTLIYGLAEAFFDIPAKNFLLPIFLFSTIVNIEEKENRQ